jgi:SprT protein
MTGQPGQAAATDRTLQLLAAAEQKFELKPSLPDILFDLKGKSAGLLVIHSSGHTKIRYNGELLKLYGTKFIEQTVPHEVAHLIARRVYGKAIKPHGKEWQAIMAYFNVPANRCHSFDTTKTAHRRMRYFDYQCACKCHQISAIRHNRMLSGVTYLCRICGTSLVLKTSG